MAAVSAMPLSSGGAGLFHGSASYNASRQHVCGLEIKSSAKRYEMSVSRGPETLQRGQIRKLMRDRAEDQQEEPVSKIRWEMMPWSGCLIYICMVRKYTDERSNFAVVVFVGCCVPHD